MSKDVGKATRIPTPNDLDQRKISPFSNPVSIAVNNRDMKKLIAIAIIEANM